ncbi:ATP-grasp domain-containing protein [Neobacillus notoginsengisoli]|uniref:ATP-grasp domain-containing protein n=1 Tax=Neobacillus notoginsengisoli TaxID=1578198 RepID=A0A417YZ46_9BACI|nr:ATP-grasp domain-containing protein [Neobacillus notoginsengisoli]RHW42787.1 ATP-grasp domain-containing protein [Neobacillus notoginsengisoli]
MNILICSAGRRAKLVEFFKEELHKNGGKVVAVDCDSTASALYHADFHEVVPRIDDPSYINHIIDLCKKYDIAGVLSLIDPELTLLANCKEEFERNSIQVIVSDKNVVECCFDKYLTFQFCQEHDLPCVPTYTDIDKIINDINHHELEFPLIVKPRRGSASIGIHKVETVQELYFYQDKAEEIVIQPFISGEEFGVDCYVDFITNEVTSIFLKRKISMRSGETDKSVSYKDPILKEIIEELVVVLKPNGPIDVDCFKTESGYMISEINPRFGGGYLHAHVSGQNFVKNIINNLKGLPNVPNEDHYEEGKKLVKFDHFIVL